ncbi:synaptic vesicular amine transporter-like [Littorina saxatilis]|uniref:synaptic vesicular amine transporter-like n=1 Tax=Littorina saxatilis TaxID=31220 RepID=UPI0038B4A2ED
MAMGVFGIIHNLSDRLAKIRQSRSLVLFIVFIAIFLDNMLLTTVVPVVPNFLRRMEHVNMNTTTRRYLIGTTDEPSWQNMTTCVQRLDMPDGDREGYSWLHKLPKYYAHSTVSPLLCYNQSVAYGNQSEPRYRNVTEQVPLPRTAAEMASEDVRVGVLFASKAVVQLLANPFVGPLTSRIGYTIPMFTGFCVMMVSTIIFAFGESYTVLFIARSVQGIGSSCSSVAGMGMLACYYPDDKERGNAMGIALGGLALGVLLGPPFGGVMYEFTGKETPFLILAFLAFADGCLQLIAMRPSVKPDSQEGPSLKELVKDPYILLAAGSITFANMGIAMMEPSLPIWMYRTMGAPEWQQGIAFLPASLSYMLGTNLFGPLGHKMGRWRSAMVGMMIIGLCLFAIPFSTNIGHLIAPNFGMGLAIGMVDSSMMPHMGYLVDLRHASVYGSVYAIADVAFCLGFAVGPALSGTIVDKLGFHWMLWIIAIVNLIYAPFLWFLRNPPGKEEKQCLILNDKCPVQYVTYNQTSESNAPSDEEDGYMDY